MLIFFYKKPTPPKFFELSLPKRYLHALAEIETAGNRTFGFAT